MPEMDSSTDARRRLVAWYLGYLRPRVIEAVRERRVSAAVASNFENDLRDLLGVPAPRPQTVRVAATRRRLR